MNFIRIIILVTCAVIVNRVDCQGNRPLHQALQNVGSDLSSALQSPGQTLATYFPAGLAGLFPFSVSNLPSLPPIQLPQRIPQLVMNGLRNATQIVRHSLMNPVGGTVAVFAAPLIPLMAMGGPASLAGMHHAMNMGFNEYRSADERRRRRRQRRRQDVIGNNIKQLYHHRQHRLS